MSKIRVHLLAKELGISSKDLVENLKSKGLDVKNHMSTITLEEADKVKLEYNKPSTPKKSIDKPVSNNSEKKSPEKNNSEKSSSEKNTSQRNNNTQRKNETQKNNENHRRNDFQKNNENQKRNEPQKRDNSFQKKSKSYDNNRQGEKGKQSGNNSQKFRNNQNNKTDNSDSKPYNKNQGNNKNKFNNQNKFDSEQREVTDNRQKKSKYNNEDNNNRNKNNKKNNKNNKNNKKSFGDDLDLNDLPKRDLTKKRPKKKVKPQKKPKENLQEGDGSIISISTPISVKDFAEQINIPVGQVITKLIGLGIMASQNETIEEEVCVLVAEDLGVEVVVEEPEEEESIEEKMGLDFEDNEKNLKSRPPVVTVMGHVDHGKTSLLDVIKSSHITAQEAGGITQHIGAYTVNVNNKKVTFLDTPGHEAFTSMRLRGALITDIAILVVAADDGVMPQTIEAISHAKAANVPIIVAINKIDKPTANQDRVQQELVENGLMPEDWGGDTITVPVSAKTEEGIDDLLEMILLVAEMQELKANPNRKAIGTVIEAKLDKGKGPMATVLVQKGTLRFGDNVVSGVAYGHIRAMNDDKGRNIKKAGPSMPAVILGLNEVPNAGDLIYAVEDEKTARTIAESNRAKEREIRLNSGIKVSLDNLFDKLKEGEMKDLNLIVKGDVKGSVEALNQSLLKLSNEEVKINIVHSGVGGIKESDITLASASSAIVIGFNVRPNINALELSKSEEVDVRTYRVIYDIINDIESAVKGMLQPTIVEEILGRCEVRQTFKLPNNSIVAGIYVLNGKIQRKAMVKVLRDDIVIHEGEIGSLRRFKDDVKELNAGFEGGLGMDGFNDIKVGDLLECYILKEVRED